MSPRKWKGRGGFTLIELLVVVAIIAILMALLLPVVQKVCEAGASMTCSNAVRRMARSGHNYPDGYGDLPPGRLDHRGGVTWAGLILPYLEQDNYYKQWDITRLYYAQGPTV